MAAKRYCVEVRAAGSDIWTGVYWTDRKVVARRYAQSMAARAGIVAARVVDEWTANTWSVSIDK